MKGSCGQCYKTFFVGNLQNLDFPPTEITGMGKFKRNR